MLTVAAVLRSGGDFDATWVEKLERSCFEKIREPHRFVCLTDLKVGGSWIDWRPLEHTWPGWWAKIELFRPDLFQKGEPVLYFDLDTIVVRDVSHLSGTIDCDLVLLRDFYRLQAGWGTGIMGWTAGSLGQIYETFKASPRTFISKYRSDQDFIKMLVPPSWIRFWQDEYPDQFVSYKIHCRERGVFPPTAHVVCFHGRPRPTEIFGDWVQEYWRKR
jgi:hypothetical protein